MTKRDDVVVPGSADHGATSPPGDGPDRPTGGTPAAPRRPARAAKKPAPPTAAPDPDPSSADQGSQQAGDGQGATRAGVFASGASEWASLADPQADAPGGPYSTGVSGHGADIGVLGTDDGTGTGVGVLGTVTNPDNSQPAVYGFTQGTGPGVQGESDGPGPGLLGTDNATGTGYGVFGELTNPLNTKAAIYGSTAGTGAAVEGDSNGPDRVSSVSARAPVPVSGERAWDRTPASKARVPERGRGCWPSMTAVARLSRSRDRPPSPAVAWPPSRPRRRA